MSVSDQGLRRVAIHTGSAVIDVALPSQMPVGTLIPPIVDIVEGDTADGSADRTGRRYQLFRPGRAALHAAMTLAQHGIRDGDVLVLSHAQPPMPSPRYDDVAEAVSATLDARAWGPSHHRRAARLAGALTAGLLTGVGGLALIRSAALSRHLFATAGIAGLAGFVALMSATFAYRTYRDPIAGISLGVIATEFAALAGFLVVPGAPCLPKVLLAAMAVSVTALIALRVSGCGAITFTAILSFAMMSAVAALSGVITAAPLRTISPVFALVSLGLLGVSARLSIILAGLSGFEPRNDDLPGKAIGSEALLTSLLAAFSCAAAVGAIITALGGAPRPGRIAFAALAGALMLLRALPIERRTLVCAISGVVTIATALGCGAISARQYGPWVAAATAALVATAISLPFVAPAVSPLVRRSVELLECLGLASMAPLTCWVCGFYGAARHLYPTWG